MNVSASIHSELHLHQVRVETNGTSKQLTIAPKPDGSGSSINGAELLLLSVATCFCNDIYREAAKRSVARSKDQADPVFGEKSDIPIYPVFRTFYDPDIAGTDNQHQQQSRP